MYAASESIQTTSKSMSTSSSHFFCTNSCIFASSISGGMVPIKTLVFFVSVKSNGISSSCQGFSPSIFSLIFATRALFSLYSLDQLITCSASSVMALAFCISCVSFSLSIKGLPSSELNIPFVSGEKVSITSSACSVRLSFLLNSLLTSFVSVVTKPSSSLRDLSSLSSMVPSVWIFSRISCLSFFNAQIPIFCICNTAILHSPF